MILSSFSDQEWSEGLTRCCGSLQWVKQMLARRPFSTGADLHQASREIWPTLRTEDFLEAFLHHPQIGDTESIKKKFASTSTWASGEQKSVATADEKTLSDLAEWNQKYFEKFGFIFIICATGKSPDFILSALRTRFANSRETEIQNASQEQFQITELRLDKLTQRSASS